jgi:hypothetical protein
MDGGIDTYYVEMEREEKRRGEKRREETRR